MSAGKKTGARQLVSLLHEFQARGFPKRLNEAATREQLIDPLLIQLGWKIDGSNEVLRSVSLGFGRIDYVLLPSQRHPILLEAKKLSEDLKTHERQLLLYPPCQHP
jgi:predicted type IV restriction endonuclease